MNEIELGQEVEKYLQWFTQLEADEKFFLSQGYKDGLITSLTPQWVPVSERLPELEGNFFSKLVLAIDERGKYHLVKYDYGFNRWNTPPHSYEIIFWMELPTPPNS